METTVIVQVRNVYGNQVAYPVNEAAKLFARLTNTKTLTPEALNVIHKLGYKVEVQSEFAAFVIA